MARKARQRASWGSNEDAGGGKRRLRYWADLRDGKGYRRVSETIVGSRREGDEVLARRRIEHSSDAPAPTLRQAYEMWWLPDFRDKREKGELSANTAKVYMNWWGSVVLPKWGDVPVTDIRPLDIQSWLLDLSPTAAKKGLSLMSQCLDMCVKYEALGRNPAAVKFRMPRKPARERDKGVYTREELWAVLEAIRGTPAYLPAVLCGTASCRLGEALGPSVTEGDVLRVEARGQVLAAVRVRRQVDRLGKVVDSLKTAQSERWVIVPEPWSADVLAAEGPWLCERGDGRPMSQAATVRAWDAALGSSGLRRVPMQNLRNSWRTFMRWELKVPEDMLEKMMGHAGKNIGEIHYDRPEMEVFADAVAEAYAQLRGGGNS